MKTRAFHGTVRKYGDVQLERLTSPLGNETDDSDYDIKLRDDTASDDYVSDYPGLTETSQELRDVMNSSSNSDWVVFFPTTREDSFTAEEK